MFCILRCSENDTNVIELGFITVDLVHDNITYPYKLYYSTNPVVADPPWSTNNVGVTAVTNMVHYMSKVLNCDDYIRKPHITTGSDHIDTEYLSHKMSRHYELRGKIPQINKPAMIKTKVKIVMRLWECATLDNLISYKCSIKVYNDEMLMQKAKYSVSNDYVHERTDMEQYISKSINDISIMTGWRQVLIREPPYTTSVCVTDTMFVHATTDPKQSPRPVITTKAGSEYNIIYKALSY